LAELDDPAAQALLKQRKAKNSPKYPDWFNPYLKAWEQLRYDRSYGSNGTGRIWYHSMSSYAASHGFVGETFSDFIQYLTALDNEYLEVVQEMIDKETAKAKQ
jgi:hypothetical protein